MRGSCLQSLVKGLDQFRRDQLVAVMLPEIDHFEHIALLRLIRVHIYEDMLPDQQGLDVVHELIGQGVVTDQHTFGVADQGFDVVQKLKVGMYLHQDGHELVKYEKRDSVSVPTRDSEQGLGLNHVSEVAALKKTSLIRIRLEPVLREVS